MASQGKVDLKAAVQKQIKKLRKQPLPDAKTLAKALKVPPEQVNELEKQLKDLNKASQKFSKGVSR